MAKEHKKTEQRSSAAAQQSSTEESGRGTAPARSTEENYRGAAQQSSADEVRKEEQLPEAVWKNSVEEDHSGAVKRTVAEMRQ